MVGNFHDPRQNHLLAAMPQQVFERLEPYLLLTPMPPGKVLYETGSKLASVYFPTTCIVSLIYTMKDGRSTEIALTGNEGMLGVSLILGGKVVPNRAVVQSAGHAYRLKAPLLMNEFNSSGELQQSLLRFTLTLLTQIAQTAVCNQHHSVEQQLCRWMLLSLDRLPSNTLSMTHELIADRLGVRRMGVSEAAGKLQRAGLIKYNRGQITILERARLEAQSCECYGVLKAEYNRMFAPAISYPLVVGA